MTTKYEFKNEKELLSGFLSFVNAYAFVSETIEFDDKGKINFYGKGVLSGYSIKGVVDYQHILDNFDCIRNEILEKQESFLKKREEDFNNKIVPKILNYKVDNLVNFIELLVKYSIPDYLHYNLSNKLTLYLEFNAGGAASILERPSGRPLSWTTEMRNIVLSYADDIKTYFIKRCKERIQEDWVSFNTFKKRIEIFNPKNNNGYVEE